MVTTKNPTVKNYQLTSTDRASIRTELFTLWTKELPGTSSTTNTYRYNVEILADGSAIYLSRPTRLNKGADFVICCEGFLKFKNGNDKPPRHEDLISEAISLTPGSESRAELLHALACIYRCEDSAVVVRSLQALQNNSRAERVLFIAKWFFIEQDLTYWTQSGRQMLRDELEARLGTFPA
ncbi:hypothetical protein AEM42_10345 [Betaproteobacteria bacterium UKL13-2]|jgi:hypothetical protein|nr:hypothetical protein AEM42_10345 [Betaproteobacteria bacterium UKL13-2]HCG53832.1 hypothetical protein [Betaproteobacteria bacterium]